MEICSDHVSKAVLSLIMLKLTKCCSNLAFCIRFHIDSQESFITNFYTPSPPHCALSSLANWLCCDYNFHNMLHGSISFFKPKKGWMLFHRQRKHNCKRCRKVSHFLVLMRSSLMCTHLQNHTLQQSSL